MAWELQAALSLDVCPWLAQGERAGTLFCSGGSCVMHMGRAGSWTAPTAGGVPLCCPLLSLDPQALGRGRHWLLASRTCVALSGSTCLVSKTGSLARSPPGPLPPPALTGEGLVSGVAVTRYCDLRSFHQQQLVLSQLWRPEVQNQGALRVGSLARPLGSTLSRPPSQPLVAASAPWQPGLAGASPGPRLCGHTALFCVLNLPLLLSHKDTCSWV